MVQKKSESLSVLLGIGLLALVLLGAGGIAYSFYRTEIAEEQEESSDMANDDSPFEQLKREKNMVITPVPTSQGGSGSSTNKPGIPTGTYSNPPSTINPAGGSYSTQTSSPLDDFDSSVESNRLNRDRLDNTPDYSRPASSNNFNNNDGSLIEPLENEPLWETPSNTTDSSLERSPLEQSPF